MAGLLCTADSADTVFEMQIKQPQAAAWLSAISMDACVRPCYEPDTGNDDKKQQQQQSLCKKTPS